MLAQRAASRRTSDNYRYRSDSSLSRQHKRGFGDTWNRRIGVRKLYTWQNYQLKAKDSREHNRWQDVASKSQLLGLRRAGPRRQTGHASDESVSEVVKAKSARCSRSCVWKREKCEELQGRPPFHTLAHSSPIGRRLAGQARAPKVRALAARGAILFPDEHRIPLRI